MKCKRCLKKFSSTSGFFRDPEASFEQLKEQVFPAISQNKSSDTPIRIWVAGCSTGKKFTRSPFPSTESFSRSRHRCAIQIFATDIQRNHDQQNESGSYLKARWKRFIRRRDRFFVAMSTGGYQISSTQSVNCCWARRSAGPRFSGILIWLAVSQSADLPIRALRDALFLCFTTVLTQRAF